MLLVVIVTLLVLGVAFYQAVQGWFSSLIMAVLTICCALVSRLFLDRSSSASRPVAAGSCR